MAEPLVSAGPIDHVALITGDADRTARWYAEHLGLHVVRDEFVDAVGVRLVWLYPRGCSPGGTAAGLQLLEPHRPGPPLTHLRERGEGLHHFCFAVDDLDAVLRSAGQPPEDAFTGGFGLPCAFLAESAGGELVELVQRPAPPA
ncbi:MULTISPECIES: VOC family protein [unclassified Saccharopolyspora]|uniref:VOC family protein n=1 Tax=unclassified Saccharopolyspora TaxID=2646250 RepID=UPI001CD1E1E9|nr:MULTISPECIES: VOC family protein [unclassified Saccharopolyspora]MCA1184888.1 VOC family protein [Saccharopolyspora sp. 6T]MCA1283652.1 VOC family protein [Saccharopolyspora sp. 7B]